MISSLLSEVQRGDGLAESVIITMRRLFPILLVIAALALPQIPLRLQRETAMQCYESAERYYQAGKLHDARRLSEKALKLDSDNPGAKALLYEVQILTGVVPRPTKPSIFCESMCRWSLDHDEIFKKGLRSYIEGLRSGDPRRFDEAEGRFGLLKEYRKWVYPPTITDQFWLRVEEMLQRVRYARHPMCASGS